MRTGGPISTSARRHNLLYSSAARLMDVFSTVAAVIGLCSTLVQCIGKFVSQVGAHEVVNSLRKDLQELFRELELLHAELPRDVRLEHQIEEEVMKVSHDCQNELSKLRFIILEEFNNRI